jgi:hypothetical protein
MSILCTEASVIAQQNKVCKLSVARAVSAPRLLEDSYLIDLTADVTDSVAVAMLAA